MTIKSRRPYTRKLYHFTSTAAAVDIEQSGFKPGLENLVWFAEHPSLVEGESSMEVLFEIVAVVRVIAPHARQIHWVDLDDLPIPSRVEPSPTYRWFALPPDIANSFKRRRVPDAETLKMMI